jgi:hypothetical protein
MSTKRKAHPLLDGLSELYGSYYDRTDGSGLFAKVCERVHTNWSQREQPDRWPTAKNWRVRLAPNFTTETDHHLEKQLQKQIAITFHNEGWGNDMPTLAGTVGVGTPEPATWMSLALGLVAVVLRKRRIR